jgi:predicted ATPase
VPSPTPSAWRRPPGESLLSTLCAAVGARRLLLVLDNAEHVAPACAELVRALLAAGSGVRVLVTSQVAVRVLGETVFEVPPLSLSSPGSRGDAVTLFHERASAVGTDLGGEDDETVAAVCRELDALPLGIELAAAHSAVVGVRGLLELIEGPARLSLEGDDAALPRHRTLEAALRWSYDLLAPAQQVAFARLAVFPGGFSSDAAEQVLAVAPPLTAGGANGAPTDAPLAELVARSLLTVVAARAGPRRYRLLETLRAFAAARLAERGEAAPVAAAHARWVAALAEEAEPHLRAADHDPLLALRIGAALGWFWYRTGYITEGRAWLDRALVRAEDVEAPPGVVARALLARAGLDYLAGDLARMGALDDAAARAQEAGDAALVATVAYYQAWAHALGGDLSAAVARLDDAHRASTTTSPGVDPCRRRDDAGHARARTGAPRRGARPARRRGEHRPRRGAPVGRALLRLVRRQDGAGGR